MCVLYILLRHAQRPIYVTRSKSAQLIFYPRPLCVIQYAQLRRIANTAGIYKPNPHHSSHRARIPFSRRPSNFSLRKQRPYSHFFMTLNHPFLCLALGALFILSTKALAETCPPGTFRQSATCKKCPPGTYQNLPDKPTCKKCPAGTFTQFRGVISERLCQRCPDDSNSLPGSSSCFKCPNGHVRRCQKCIRCPPGSYLSGCECSRCSPDSFSTEANVDECTKCPPNQRATSDRKRCRDARCPPGTEFDFDECLDCMYLNFRNSSMTRCEPCPPRTTFLDFFSPKVQCMKCPPGQFTTDVFTTNTFEGVPICLPCPPGRTTLGSGKVLCRRIGGPCPSNFFEDEDGDCDICDKNQRFVPSLKKCVNCAPNEFSRGGLVTSCEKCPPGHVFSGFECECPLGQISVKGKCRSCPAGTFRNENSGNTCIECDGDSFSKKGATECTKCPPGTISEESKGRKCRSFPKCPDGFIIPPLFTSAFSAFVCISGSTGCPKGLTGAGFVSGRFLCRNKKGKVVCPKGSVFDNKDDCLSCSIGFKLTQKPSGELQCNPCERTKVSKGGLARKCRKCKGDLIPDGINENCVCPFSLVGNSKKCTQSNRCPSGTIPVTNPLGRVRCVECLPGTFQSGEDCFNCPVNKTSVLGATKCKACPSGTGTYDAGGEIEDAPVGDANCVPF